LSAKYGHSVTIRTEAASDRSAEADFFFYPHSSGLSGLARRSFRSAPVPITTITVPLRPLDLCLNQNDSIDFIKIDVEGGELAVLRGAARTIRSSNPAIWCEHHKWGAPGFGESAESFWELVTNTLEMQIFSARSWLLGLPPYSHQEFLDCVESAQVMDYLLIPKSATPSLDSLSV
jgi:FkbM family methyltransferase